MYKRLYPYYQRLSLKAQKGYKILVELIISIFLVELSKLKLLKIVIR